ncbi:hypothetical protein Tco_1362427 [Tanacetum coccineum]
MASMKYCDKHNQVGFLKKPKECTGFAEIVDFLKGSYIRYTLSHNPTIHDSLVKQFWQTATASTLAHRTLELRATIDTLEYTITEASVRMDGRLFWMFRLGMVGGGLGVWRIGLLLSECCGVGVVVFGVGVCFAGLLCGWLGADLGGFVWICRCYVGCCVSSDCVVDGFFGLSLSRCCVQWLLVDSSFCLFGGDGELVGGAFVCGVGGVGWVQCGLVSLGLGGLLKYVLKGDIWFTMISEDEDAEFSSKQGRNLQEEAKTLSQRLLLRGSKSVDKGKRYKRRKESKGKDIDTGFEDISTGFEGISTGFEEVNTGGLGVSTGSGPVSSTRGQRIAEEEELTEMVDLVNQRKKHFAEERAKAKRNKPMTQSQLRIYMSNYLKNQGTWKLSQLKKLKFEEIKEEFEKLTEISKKQRIDDKDVSDTEEKVGKVKEEEPGKRVGKRKKQKARKGISIDKIPQGDTETDKEESVEAMNPTPLDTKSNIVANWKIFQQEDLIEHTGGYAEIWTNRPEDASGTVYMGDSQDYGLIHLSMKDAIGAYLTGKR